MQSLQIKWPDCFDGITLEIEGEYDSGEISSWDGPGCDESFEIKEIWTELRTYSKEHGYSACLSDVFPVFNQSPDLMTELESRCLAFLKEL